MIDHPTPVQTGLSETVLFPAYRETRRTVSADVALTIAGHATTVVLHEAIAERWRWRSWYRARPSTIAWPTRWENDRILRELVKLGRRSRRLAAPSIRQASASVTESESEQRYAWGDR